MSGHWGKFNWQDPFRLDDQLTDEERMIRDSAAAFAAAELQTRVEDMYINEGVEPGLFRLMGQAGLLGVTIPEQYGGAGAGYVAYGRVARALAFWRAPQFRLMSRFNEN